jgi:LuxR family maltose regulon positive regulatory protein
LISAPAGFGKTTLVSAWLGQIEQRVAWFSLDEDDNDPTRFLTYLLAAFQKVDPAMGQGAQEMLQAQGVLSLSPETLLTTLINDVATASVEWVLVLDDYHLIHTQAIHTALTFLIDHQPRGLHLVLTSRADPPLPLARLRARGRLLELRAADLRFTPAEADQFLRQVMGLQLSPADSAALEARTEGWVAGLQLAALSLHGLTDMSSFIRAFSGSHRHIVDYLAEEVLHRQPEEIQEFLLQTSILERLYGSLCDALLGRSADEVPRGGFALARRGQEQEKFHIPKGSQGEASRWSREAKPKGEVNILPLPSNSQTILERLEVANLFIIPLDNVRHWYRYHHLFADLLQARLQQTQPPDRIIELHRRAAEWYEANGFVGDAIRHAIKGDDTERVVRLVTANARSMLAQGQVTTLQGWLDALPQEVIYAQPSLCLSQAWLWLLRRRLQPIESYLQAAEQALAGAGSAQQAAGQGEIAAIRAFVASEQGQFNQALALARQALALLPESNVFARGSSALALGNALFSLGDTGPAVAALRESVTLCRAADNALGALYSLGTLIVLLTLQGQLRQAEQVLQEAFNWTADRHWQQIPPAAALYIRLGDIRREQNDLAAAEQLLTQAVQLAQLGAPILIVRAQAFLARVKQTQSDTAATDALLRQVKQISQGWETGQEVAYFVAYQIRLALQQGRLAEATAWAGQLPPWSPEETPNYFREFELVTLARVRLTQGVAQSGGPHLVEALPLLIWLRQQAKAAGRIGIVIEVLILEALTRAAQSDVSRALTLLEQALTLAEPEGYLRLFLDEGEPLAALLAQLPPSPYRDQLLAAFSEAGKLKFTSTPLPSRSLGLIEPLSDRELEVLRLMAEGYSNREIAEKLVFTVATAKKHAENIYSKLGVHSRTQALVRARELKLL